MKNLFFVLLMVVGNQNVLAQNIPHANYSALWGVEVNTYNGNLYLERTDLVIPNQGLAIEFSFAYNSFRDTLDLGFGLGWTSNYHLTYDTIGTDSMVVEQADGRRDIFVKKGTAYQAPSGIFDVWENYESGKFRLTTKYGMRYYFDDATHRSLTRIEDTNGNSLTLAYNAAQELSTVTDHSGRNVNLTWSGGHLQNITDNNFSVSRSIQFTYNGPLLTTVTDPEGGTMNYQYNSKKAMSTILNENGDELNIVFNREGRVAKIGTCFTKTTFTYNTENRKTYVTEKNNSGDRVTTYDYDEEGKLLQKTGNCCGYNTQYQYDTDNNVNSLTDANGYQSSANHDARGNALFTADATGASQAFTFEPTYNRLTMLRDKNGNATTMQYDAQGNMEKINQPEGVTIGFAYTAVGSVNVVTDGNGQNTNLTYNGNNDVTTIAYPIGSENFSYDAVGNLLSSQDGNGNTVTYTYDKLNRLQKIADDLGNEVSYQYDFASNLNREVDANGHEKNYVYDAHHRLTSVTTPSGTTEYQYDASDNLTAIVDANQHLTTFQYDTRDLLIEEKDPLQNTTAYSYDGNGNVLTRSDANGMLTTYTYDRLNRLTSKSYDGNTDSYGYDANGNLTFCSNNEISMNFTYDGLNRLTSKTINNWGLTIAYGYDFAGNRTSMTDPSGTTLYEYDANNRLVKMTNPAGEISGFTYDAGGRLTRQDYANGTFTEYTYDVANRLVNMIHKNSSNSVLARYGYTYDNNGNRVLMSTIDGTASYTYDGDNRLITATYNGIPAPAETYELDATGNRIELNGTVYTYDEADRLKSQGTTTYDFDGNGNTILKNENGNITRYTYDGENRLVKVQLPNGEKVNFQYDPFGNRISQQNASGTTRYLLDGDNVLLELDASGSTLARYTTGLTLDSWISMERGGQSYFYHTDGLGSVTALTGAGQSIEQQYQYDAYGNILAQTGNVANPYTYTGREWDEAIGLYYYRTRFYDAEVGRFLTKDGFPGFTIRPLSLNRYSYVEGNPINNIDPNGKFWLNIGGGLVSAGLTALTDVLEHGWNLICYDWTEIAISFGTGLLSPMGSIRNGVSLLGKAKRIEKALPIIRKQRDIQNKVRKDVPALRNRYKSDEELKGNIDRLRNKGRQELIGGVIDKAGYAKSGGDYIKYKIDGSKPCSVPQTTGSQEEDPIGPPPPPPTLPPIGDDVNIPIIRSADPNEIIAPTGCGLEKWVAQSATLPYTILYENDPDFATAPAQTVVVEHVFDSEINPFSFRLGDFGFGDYYFTVPEDLSFYNTQIDLSDSLGVLLDVVAGIDVTNNKAFWIFESKDPATGFPGTLPADVGFLPVNDSLTHVGEGFVNFTVRAKESSVTGDTIHAQAEIIFDQNPAIETNVAFNLIDADAPISQIDDVTIMGNQYQLTWSATDVGSGTSRYNLYASTDSVVFLPIVDNLTETTYVFTGQPDSSYQFFSVAIDCVGNREALKAIVDCGLTLADTTLVQPTNNQANGSITIEVQGASGALTFEWLPNVSTDAMATGLAAGIYSVTVSDELGCSFTLEINLTDVILATHEPAALSELFIHRLYPSPAQSEVKVEFTTRERIIWLEVFDAAGKVVLAKTVKSEPGKINQETLSVNEWAAGNYIVRISSKTQRVSGMFVKQ